MEPLGVCTLQRKQHSFLVRRIHVPLDTRKAIMFPFVLGNTRLILFPNWITAKGIQYRRSCPFLAKASIHTSDAIDQIRFYPIVIGAP